MDMRIGGRQVPGMSGPVKNGRLTVCRDYKTVAKFRRGYARRYLNTSQLVGVMRGFAGMIRTVSLRDSPIPEEHRSWLEARFRQRFRPSQPACTVGDPSFGSSQKGDPLVP